LGLRVGVGLTVVTILYNLACGVAEGPTLCIDSIIFFFITGVGDGKNRRNDVGTGIFLKYLFSVGSAAFERISVEELCTATTIVTAISIIAIKSTIPIVL